MADRKRLGLRDVRALAPNQEVWDAAVPGFGARRQKSDVISYVLMYRTGEGRQRRFTIGRHGAPWTPDMARDEAIRLLGKIKAGADPAADKHDARAAMTIAELCDVYLADAAAGRLLTRRGTSKKSSTLEIDKGRIERHIKPLLGRMAVGAVSRIDIEHAMHAIAEGKTAERIKTKPRGVARVTGGRGTSARTIGLLGGIFTYAVRKGLRSDNPVHGVIRFADGHRQRRLSDAEYAALGAGLRQAEGTIWPQVIACTRFLALTGWRSGEAIALTWRDVDLERRTATLSDTKTGRSMRPLSKAACALLRSQPRLGTDVLVFPATRGDGLLVSLKRFMGRIGALSGLPADVTPHVLRHSFASLAGDLGYAEITIGALVGHKGQRITSRYVHYADAVLLAAADAVAVETTRRMGDAQDAEEAVAWRR